MFLPVPFAMKYVSIFLHLVLLLICFCGVWLLSFGLFVSFVCSSRLLVCLLVVCLFVSLFFWLFVVVCLFVCLLVCSLPLLVCFFGFQDRVSDKADDRRHVLCSYRVGEYFI